MKKRECLYAIHDLNVTRMLEYMDDKQLNDYWDKLNSFIDIFPKLEEKTKNALNNGDHKIFASTLTYIAEILSEIHADELAKECQAQILTMTRNAQFRPEKLNAYITYLLSNISILSIDLQMASLNVQSEERLQSYEDIVKSEDDPGRAKSILAVDDQIIHLSALQSQLVDTPYQLTCVPSGKEALRFLRENLPDLFILDIMMPVMDGFQLAQKIKEARFGLLRKKPIIFVTGSSDRETITKAFEAGGRGFIVKPYTREHLLDRISRFV